MTFFVTQSCHRPRIAGNVTKCVAKRTFRNATSLSEQFWSGRWHPAMVSDMAAGGVVDR